MISTCFQGCLRRASSGRALQVPSAPPAQVEVLHQFRCHVKVEVLHLFRCFTHTYTHLQSSTCFPHDIQYIYIYTIYIYICNKPKSPKAVLFESLRKVAQRKDHRRETIAMPRIYARGFIAIVVGFHGRGFIAMSLVLQPRVYSNERFGSHDPCYKILIDTFKSHTCGWEICGILSSHRGYPYLLSSLHSIRWSIFFQKTNVMEMEENSLTITHDFRAATCTF